jgi:hypothetical protein
MKIKTISYKKIFPIASYVNETIGIEIEIDEKDNPDEVFATAKKQVEDWHTPPHIFINSESLGDISPEQAERIMRDTPLTYTESPYPKEELTPEQIREGKIEGHKTLFNMCKTIKQLEKFHPKLAEYPELKNHYDNKLIELQNK